jgi:hypothetical protein
MSDKKEPDWKPPQKNPTSLPSPKPLSDDRPMEIFDPNQPGRVSQNFLDLLNGESAKMSAALQSPDNWPAIQRAAREAPAKIAELEKEVGIHAIFGPGGAVSRETAQTMLGEKLPEGPIPQPRIVSRTPLHELIHKAEARKPWWKRMLKRLARAVGASAFSALLMPVPNMQLQTCLARFDGAVMEVRCDSSRVCPPGYHLDTHLNRFDGGADLSTLFGYGDVKNTCLLGAVVHQPNQVMEVLP